MYDSMIVDLMDHLLDLDEDPLQSLESQLKFRIGQPSEAQLDLTA